MKILNIVKESFTTIGTRFSEMKDERERLSLLNEWDINNPNSIDANTVYEMAEEIRYFSRREHNLLNTFRLNGDFDMLVNDMSCLRDRIEYVEEVLKGEVNPHNEVLVKEYEGITGQLAIISYTVHKDCAFLRNGVVPGFIKIPEDLSISFVLQNKPGPQTQEEIDAAMDEYLMEEPWNRKGHEVSGTLLNINEYGDSVHSIIRRLVEMSANRHTINFSSDSTEPETFEINFSEGTFIPTPSSIPGETCVMFNHGWIGDDYVVLDDFEITNW